MGVSDTPGTGRQTTAAVAAGHLAVGFHRQGNQGENPKQWASLRGCAEAATKGHSSCPSHKACMRWVQTSTATPALTPSHGMATLPFSIRNRQKRNPAHALAALLWAGGPDVGVELQVCAPGGGRPPTLRRGARPGLTACKQLCDPTKPNSRVLRRSHFKFKYLSTGESRFLNRFASLQVECGHVADLAAALLPPWVVLKGLAAPRALIGLQDLTCRAAECVADGRALGHLPFPGPASGDLSGRLALRGLILPLSQVECRASGHGTCLMNVSYYF